MKKTASLLLALILCMSLTAPAFAVEVAEVVPCQYDWAWPISEGLAGVQKDLRQWGFVDTANKVVVPFQYTQIGDFSEGMAAVKNSEGKWGFVNTTGKEVIPCQYWNVTEFSEGLAAVDGPNNQNGYIDKTGKLVIPGGGRSFSEGLAAVGGGFIDKTGAVVVPDQYEQTGDFKNGYARVSAGYLWGFVDKTGREIAPCQYYEVRDFSEGLAAVMDRSWKWGFIDGTGKEVIPCQYDSVNDFCEGMAVVSRGHFGYIDQTGREVIPCQYITAENFSEGLARVMNSSWENIYIDQTGKTVLSEAAGGVGSFSEGLATAMDSEGHGYIDKKGKAVIPFRYDATYDFRDGVARVRNSQGLYGYIDKNGKELLPCRYEEAGDFQDGCAVVKMYGKYGIVADVTGSAAKPVRPAFTDVKSGDYFVQPVEWAIEKGITNGTSATTFSPNDTCTTAHILTFLWRAVGSPAPTIANPFLDVKTGQYYTDAAIWAYEKGLVSGPAFHADRAATRAATVTYLWKLEGQPAAPAAGFTDVASATEYAKAVAWAVEQGVTNGTSDTTFSPSDTCTRGQIVTFLWRALVK